MKKICSLMLCAVLLLMPLNVSAADIPSEILTMMGDVDNNGLVNAADARFTLRVAAEIEDGSEISMLSIDADGNGTVTSADARLILRYSASLSAFDKGFDGKGTPNSFGVLKGDVFSLSVKYDDITFDIVKNGNDIKLAGMDLGEDFGGLNMEDCGLMYKDSMLYVTFTTNGKKAAMYIPEELYAQLEISEEYIYEIINEITDILPEECGIPEKLVGDGGEISFVYTVDYENGGKLEIICDNYGVVKVLKSYQDAAGEPELIEFSSISCEIPNNSFDLSGYELM